MKTSFLHLFLIALCTLLASGNGRASAAGREIPLHSKGTATFYVSGSIDEVIESDFLVDTGSGYVTIDPDTLTRLRRKGSAKFVRKISAVLADGSETVVPVYRLAALKLGGSCTIQNVEAAVIPGSNAHILGLSALGKAAPFAISLDPPTLTLSGCDGGSI